MFLNQYYTFIHKSHSFLGVIYKNVLGGSTHLLFFWQEITFNNSFHLAKPSEQNLWHQHIDQCAPLLSAGRVKTPSLPLKSAKLAVQEYP